MRTIKAIITSASDPNKRPEPCRYCDWCASKLNCPALKARVEAVAAGREDWTLKTYHSSSIDDPAEMAKALTLARQIKKWADTVEHFALDMVVKKGMQLPGFELKEGKGRSYVSDVQAAFSLAGMPQEAFLACCDLRMNTSPKYPDKVGLIDKYAQQNQIKKAPAKREILKKLEPVLKTGKGSLSLRAITETNEESEQE